MLKSKKIIYLLIGIIYCIVSAKIYEGSNYVSASMVDCVTACFVYHYDCQTTYAPSRMY